MQHRTFHDRRDAGRQVAQALKEHVALEDPLVLALPRGGVPVAVEVARVLDAELDVIVSRKLGHPLQPELAIGAVATGGVRVLLHDLSDAVPPKTREEIAAREEREVERRMQRYRAGRPPLDMRGRNVILVDDGLATGATMHAAIRAARAGGARQVVVAAPVGDPETCAQLGREADRVLCLVQPTSLVAVGYWYRAFPQLTDDDVSAALADHRPRRTRANVANCHGTVSQIDRVAPGHVRFQARERRTVVAFFRQGARRTLCLHEPADHTGACRRAAASLLPVCQHGGDRCQHR